MNTNKIAIESLSMDLMRVALGYHRGSVRTAEKFSDEANKRIQEIEKSKVKPYFSRILSKIFISLKNKDQTRIAEDALMYSVLCKNYVNKFL